MRFMVVNRPAKAEIFGQTYELKPLEPPGLETKHILVSDNGSASELFPKHRSVLMEASFETSAFPNFPVEPDTIDQIRPGSKVLIMRAGGVGDHVMLLPALLAFRECLPADVEVWLATQKEKHPIFHMHPGIDRLLPLPLGLDKLLEADFIIDFSDSLDDEHFNALHMTDYYTKVLGLNEEYDCSKTPSMSQRRNNSKRVEMAVSHIRKKKPSSPLVVLQWKSSVPLRDLPAEKLLHLAESFSEIQFVVTAPLDVNTHGSDITPSCSKRIHDISPSIQSLEDYISLFSFCDGVVSTDTAAYHIAEAFGKPSVALFGPIYSDLRIRYYKRVHAIDSAYDGKTCKAPCGLHKSFDGCPESRLLKTTHSPCLLALDEQAIHNAFEQMCDKL